MTTARTLRDETARADLQSALERIRQHGWSAREVIAVSAIVERARGLMDGLHLFELRSEHVRHAAEPEGLFAAPEVWAWRDERSSWAGRLAGLDADALLRRALWIVGEELRLGNPDARLGVELLDGVH